MQRLKGLGIHLIEDDGDTRELTELWLARHGATVHVSACGQDALDAAFDADVVICDLSLPDLDAQDIVRELRARRPVRCIAISGMRHESVDGFDAFLGKPWDPSVLLNVILGE